MTGSANDDDGIEPLMLGLDDLFERFRAAPDQKAEIDIILEMVRLKQKVEAAVSDRRAAAAKLLDRAQHATNDDDRVAELLRAFVLLTKLSYIAKDRLGDVEASNETVRQRGAIVKQLDAIGSGRRPDLTSLFAHPDAGVRHAAASWLLKIMPERALPVIRDVYEKERGTSVGILAYMTLNAYEIDPGAFKE